MKLWNSNRVLMLLSILGPAFAASAGPTDLPAGRATNALPVLILPTLKAGAQIYTNVIVTHLSTTNIFFNHAQGAADVRLNDLLPLLQRQFAWLANRRPMNPGGNESPEVVAPKLYARSLINQPAPKFDAEKWITPAPNTLGKFVLIDFWATWCAPCKGSIRDLNELQAAYQDKLVVIGISDEAAGVVRSFYEKNPPTMLGSHPLIWPRINYSIAIDTQKRMKNLVGVTGIPHAILIDPRGIVRYEGMPSFLDRNRAGLDRLFAKYSE